MKPIPTAGQLKPLPDCNNTLSGTLVGIHYCQQCDAPENYDFIIPPFKCSKG